MRYKQYDDNKEKHEESLCCWSKCALCFAEKINAGYSRPLRLNGYVILGQSR